MNYPHIMPPTCKYIVFKIMINDFLTKPKKIENCNYSIRFFLAVGLMLIYINQEMYINIYSFHKIVLNFLILSFLIFTIQ